MLGRRGIRKASQGLGPCVTCLGGFVIAICLSIASFLAWQQANPSVSTVVKVRVRCGI
jgi:hypothetical protein